MQEGEKPRRVMSVYDLGDETQAHVFARVPTVGVPEDVIRAQGPMYRCAGCGLTLQGAPDFSLLLTTGEPMRLRAAEGLQVEMLTRKLCLHQDLAWTGP